MKRAHTMPFGAQVSDQGVRFALWAPTAQEVALRLDGALQPMRAEADGWWRLVTPTARDGSRYGFLIDQKRVVPDPASRYQPDDVHNESAVVDPTSFEWTDGDWKGRPWEEAVLYEVHVGTATPEGTYAGLMGKLDTLKSIGITAIELLPLAEFPGRRNWGYDGVLPYAPDSAYGHPDDLKRLIDYAHSIGMMVLIDVVYNHFGPAGNYLHAYAASFFTDRHQTPWGAGINFDGDESGPVRDYFVHNAIYWLEEFHVDGLRFDAVHAILDDSEKHIIAEIAERVRAALPDRMVHLVLENDANEARWLVHDGEQRPVLHTAQWNDDLHHCWHTLLTGEADGYYVDYADDPVARLGRSLAEGFAYQGEPSAHRNGETRGEMSAHLPPTAFVSFLQNHDQIGNRAFGERISQLAPPDRLSLARAGLLLSPHLPMLYMGEEWAASTPFLYFVDFSDDETLAAAVREGRQKEFANFKSFAEQHDELQIPDPTSEESFSKSRLDWDEARSHPHSDALDETRQLLALRRRDVVPLMASGFVEASFHQLQRHVLEVIWRFKNGFLRFTANFSGEPVEIAVDADSTVIWSRSGSTVSGNRLTLAPWSGLFSKGMTP